ncbi:MAG: T9SS type A sorting domain-containing protein, partial [Flavobacteriales bacterium]|nr:T9SS type A sorting domain-containing protein [Flavobacteriales bacterium]
ATWCVGPVTAGQAAACADTEAWGKVCNVTIAPCSQVDGGSQSMTQGAGSGLTMYPNPNRGDQVYLNIASVEQGVSTVSVDIYELSGKRVSARTIAVQDGYLNTALELNSLTGGMYMVHITAGEKTYTERLVIQP